MFVLCIPAIPKDVPQDNLPGSARCMCILIQLFYMSMDVASKHNKTLHAIVVKAVSDHHKMKNGGYLGLIPFWS